MPDNDATRHTGPIVKVDLPPMERQAPPIVHVHVASPTSPSGERDEQQIRHDPPRRESERTGGEDRSTDQPTQPANVTQPEAPAADMHTPPNVAPGTQIDPPAQVRPTPVAEGCGTSAQKQRPEAKVKPVEKSSGPEEKTTGSDKKPEVSTSGQKQKRKYSGRGRKHTEQQIEEILDWYLLTGVLPRDVSQKQRWSYKHHRRLPERRRLFSEKGVQVVVPEIDATGTSQL